MAATGRSIKNVQTRTTSPFQQPISNPSGRPALIGRQGNDAALVRPDWSSADMRLKQQLALGHQAEDALVIDGCDAGRPTGAVEQRRDPSIAVGRARVGELSDGGHQLVVALALIAASALR